MEILKNTYSGKTRTMIFGTYDYESQKGVPKHMNINHDEILTSDEFIDATNKYNVPIDTKHFEMGER